MQTILNLRRIAAVFLVGILLYQTAYAACPESTLAPRTILSTRPAWSTLTAQRPTGNQNASAASVTSQSSKPRTAWSRIMNVIKIPAWGIILVGTLLLINLLTIIVASVWDLLPLVYSKLKNICIKMKDLRIAFLLILVIPLLVPVLVCSYLVATILSWIPILLADCLPIEIIRIMYSQKAFDQKKDIIQEYTDTTILFKRIYAFEQVPYMVDQVLNYLVENILIFTRKPAGEPSKFILDVKQQILREVWSKSSRFWHNPFFPLAMAKRVQVLNILLRVGSRDLPQAFRKSLVWCYLDPNEHSAYARSFQHFACFPTTTNDDSVIHEATHIHHERLGKKKLSTFDKAWRNLNHLEPYASNNKQWKDGISTRKTPLEKKQLKTLLEQRHPEWLSQWGPAWGFASYYGAFALNEDVATMAEVANLQPQMLATVMKKQDAYYDVYKGKLDLLLSYEFITQRQWLRVMSQVKPEKYQNTNMKASSSIENWYQLLATNRDLWNAIFSPQTTSRVFEFYKEEYASIIEQLTVIGYDKVDEIKNVLDLAKQESTETVLAEMNRFLNQDSPEFTSLWHHKPALWYLLISQALPGYILEKDDKNSTFDLPLLCLKTMKQYLEEENTTLGQHIDIYSSTPCESIDERVVFQGTDVCKNTLMASLQKRRTDVRQTISRLETLLAADPTVPAWIIEINDLGYEAIDSFFAVLHDLYLPLDKLHTTILSKSKTAKPKKPLRAEEIYPLLANQTEEIDTLLKQIYKQLENVETRRQYLENQREKYTKELVPLATLYRFLLLAQRLSTEIGIALASLGIFNVLGSSCSLWAGFNLFLSVLPLLVLIITAAVVYRKKLVRKAKKVYEKEVISSPDVSLSVQQLDYLLVDTDREIDDLALLHVTLSSELSSLKLLSKSIEEKLSIQRNQDNDVAMKQPDCFKTNVEPGEFTPFDCAA